MLVYQSKNSSFYTCSGTPTCDPGSYVGSDGTWISCNITTALDGCYIEFVYVSLSSFLCSGSAPSSKFLVIASAPAIPLNNVTEYTRATYTGPDNTLITVSGSGFPRDSDEGGVTIFSPCKASSPSADLADDYLFTSFSPNYASSTSITRRVDLYSQVRPVFLPPDRPPLTICLAARKRSS
jgi:hypothetical protein